ncbi:GGDEF domain-containing protein [Cupriavidus basilensis]|uniref:diguanylate cyclase n=1 Tax=Cupriavidus basilensis TaxID=68895 RepID=A0ABT6ANI9_9BURK|nr:GGDEF domain-containing protein [Cupriavidus basilensis]MDF3834184.1 GGDEF domain-containing protein [Cupriavidus basilensis]
MRITIDLATTLLLHNTSTLAGAIGILNTRRKSIKPRGLAMLATGFSALAVGATLSSLGERAALPPWLWAHLGLLLGVTGYVLVWGGIRSVSGRRRIHRWLMLLVPTVWFLVGIITRFPLVDTLRSSAYHLTAVCFLTAAAIELWRDRLSDPLPSRLPLIACLATSAAIEATRLIFLAGGIATFFDPATALFLQIFANFLIAFLVMALVSERTEAALLLAAQTDSLTGVGNRRWFRSRLPAKVLPGSAVAFLDLDHFKLINDRFGHPVGDQVLAAFARTIRGGLRTSDAFARFGGEEFVLYFPRVSADKAVEIAERLRKHVEAMVVDAAGTQVRVTVSIGVAWVDASDKHWDYWIQAADSACYAAKQAGRNRVARSDCNASQLEELSIC